MKNKGIPRIVLVIIVLVVVALIGGTVAFIIVGNTNKQQNEPTVNEQVVNEVENTRNRLY